MQRYTLFFLCLLSACSGHSPTAGGKIDDRGLDDKLSQQWRLYEKARDLALERVGKRHEPISREEWEKTLQIDPAFTPAEIQRLRLRQDEIAAKAKAANLARSVIDLGPLRDATMLAAQKFCSEFPKGGLLHVHPWGTLSDTALAKLLETGDPTIRATAFYDELKQTNGAMGGQLYPDELEFLKRLAARYGAEFPYKKLSPEDRAELRNLFTLQDGTHPFSRFEAFFVFAVKLLRGIPHGEEIMFDDFFTRARAEKVSYVELSYMTPLDAAKVKAWETWASSIKSRYGITTRLLATFPRSLQARDGQKNAETLLAYPPNEVFVGINIVNNETETPMLETSQILYTTLARERSSWHLSAHAGELGDKRNVRDALLLGAERIGHGVKLREDPVTLEYARLQHAAVEANLTSNLRLRVVDKIQDHPFVYFQRLGLRVSLSTDDEGIFRTDINEECARAIRESDISYAELRDMALNSIETAFATEEVKRGLKEKLQADLAAFERRWSKPYPKVGPKSLEVPKDLGGDAP